MTAVCRQRPTRNVCCGRETAQWHCKIWYVSKFTAASHGPPCNSTASYYYYASKNHVKCVIHNTNFVQLLTVPVLMVPNSNTNPDLSWPSVLSVPVLTAQAPYPHVISNFVCLKTCYYGDRTQQNMAIVLRKLYDHSKAGLEKPTFQTFF